MKKGDLIVAIVGILIMLVAFFGYRFYVNQAGDDRMVTIRFGGNVIFEEELTEETNLQILVVDGEVIETIDKNKNPNLNFNLDNVTKYNVIGIFNNGIQNLEDDSPNQDAVRKGFTNRPFDVILCLPYHLEIEIIALDIDTDLDGSV